jgi:hypothetical protein
MTHSELRAADIANGQSLIEELLKTQFPFTKALWSYDTEQGEWRLMLATPLANGGVTREAEDRLRSALGQNTVIPFEEISLVAETDPMIALLSSHVGVNGGHVTKSRLNGVYIEDIYVYGPGGNVDPPRA